MVRGTEGIIMYACVCMWVGMQVCVGITGHQQCDSVCGTNTDTNIVRMQLTYFLRLAKIEI